MLQPAGLSRRTSLRQLDVRTRGIVLLRRNGYLLPQPEGTCHVNVSCGGVMVSTNCPISPEPHGMGYCVRASGQMTTSRVGWPSPRCLTESDVYMMDVLSHYPQHHLLRPSKMYAAQTRAMTGYFDWGCRNIWACVCVCVSIVNGQRATCLEILGRDDPPVRVAKVCRRCPGSVACGCSGVSSPAWYLAGQSSVVGPLLSSPTHSVTLFSCPCPSFSTTTIVSCPAMRTMGAVPCGSLRLRATSPALHHPRRHGCT